MQFNNTDPIYVQLKDYYKKMILMGVFKNGEPVERMAGLIPKSSIINNIEKHL